MTSEPSSSTPEQPNSTPDTRGAVPADGQPTPADRIEPVRDAAPPASASREVTIRRAPKFVPFMLLGALAGFLVALVVAYTGPEDPTLTRESILGFFTVAFALPGLLLAALLVLVIDRRSIRRAERARAERTYDDGA
ncbi:hypothetical protein [Arthrobacter ruber]|uniref:hypothetical protein n=1 Tax=Arthrobacter ruber TaxID=1258893 RepID=UPI001F0CD35B|nr:hypothetical protein [Arthrobacter ruber]